MVTVAVPLLLVSIVETALTVRVSAVSSEATVSRPSALIVVPPAWLPSMLQVTVWAGLFVPVTVT